MLLPLTAGLLYFFQCVLSLGDKGDQFTKYSFNRAELNHYKGQVKELFFFAYDSYIENAYPSDELKPISCVPNARILDGLEDAAKNDVLGNFSVTLIDSLTTVAIFNDRAKFQQMVELVRETFPRKFDIDSTVQVFETTIRVLGGLISAHLYATDPSKTVYLGADYDGVLLELARDMADRLLPAYLTATGLPLARINLRHGLVGLTADMVAENNVAAMACPTFELTMLSYLTYDDKYAAVSRYAMNKTWALRSELDLLPMSFNSKTGQCYSYFTGIGASIDSFYEYALKGSVLFDDQHLSEIWYDSYEALRIHCKADWFFVNSHATGGQMTTPWIDSLSAFFPGLQVLAGDIEDSVRKNLMSLKLWDTFGGIPERWRFQEEVFQLEDSTLSEEQLIALQQRSSVPLEWYPLRPEFIESTYFLYRATKDPFYLNIGLAVLESLQTRFKHKCGFGGIQDVITGEAQDRMESFVLSETLKYLYLLFDEDNELHHSRDNVVFSTEAHPMWTRPDTKRNYARNRHFTNQLFLRHLKACKDTDARAVAKSRKRSFLKKGLPRFAKALFRDETSANATNVPKRAPLAPLCPVVETSNGPWQFSALLSGFDRLFEIDQRYNATLIKPSHMANSQPLELSSGFYHQWADHKQSVSRAPPTTTSFELVMDIPGRGHWIQHSNGSITSNTLNGRWKFRIEKLQPGLLDVYGQEVTNSLFQEANCMNLFEPTQEDRYSPSLLYRVTVLNGLHLPRDGQIILNRTAVFEVPENANLLSELFGYTSLQQLMLDSTPIVNLLLA